LLFPPGLKPPLGGHDASRPHKNSQPAHRSDTVSLLKKILLLYDEQLNLSNTLACVWWGGWGTCSDGRMTFAAGHRRCHRLPTRWL